MISLGLPRIPQRGRIFSSVFIDTFGWGLFAPLAFLYFSYNTGLSFSAIGSAVSAGTLATLPTALLAGWLVDRFSPKAVLVSSNLVTALGYGLYPFASEWTLIAVATFLVMAGDRLYWASWPVIVVDLASGRKLDATYAAVGTIKNFTVATGALASSGLTVVLGHGAADLVLALNVVTSLVAAVLLAGVRIPATRPGPEPGATEEEQENPGRPAPAGGTPSRITRSPGSASSSCSSPSPGPCPRRSCPPTPWRSWSCPTGHRPSSSGSTASPSCWRRCR